MVRPLIFSSLAIIAVFTLINNHELMRPSAHTPPQTPELTAPSCLSKAITNLPTQVSRQQTPSPWSRAKEHYSEQLKGSWILSTANASSLVWQGMIISFDDAGQFIHTSFNPLKREYNLVRQGKIDYAIDSNGTLDATLSIATNNDSTLVPSVTALTLKPINLSFDGAHIKLHGNKLVISMPQRSYQTPPLTYHFTRLQNIKGRIKGTWLRDNVDTSASNTSCHINAAGHFQLGRPIHCVLIYVLNNTLIDVSLTATPNSPYVQHHSGLRLSQTHSDKETLTIRRILFDSRASASSAPHDIDHDEGSSLIFLPSDTRDRTRKFMSNLTPQTAHSITRLLSNSEQREDFKH